MDFSSLAISLDDPVLLRSDDSICHAVHHKIESPQLSSFPLGIEINRSAPCSIFFFLDASRSMSNCVTISSYLHGQFYTVHGKANAHLIFARCPGEEF